MLMNIISWLMNIIIATMMSAAGSDVSLLEEALVVDPFDGRPSTAHRCQEVSGRWGGRGE